MIQYHSDSAIHFHQLITMFEGFKTLNLVKMLTFNLNNGYIYFLTHLVFALPALISEDVNLLVLITRWVTTWFALGSVVVLYSLSRKSLSQLSAIVICSLVVVQPMFFIASEWFRPDWALGFVLLLSIWFFHKDNQLFSRSFFIGSILLGVAVSIKTQAITFLPLLFFYCYFGPLLRLNVGGLKRMSKKFLQAFALLTSTFILLTPYVLHPVGFYGITRRFFREMSFMSTNTFTDVSMPFIERIDLINRHFTPSFVFVFILGLVVLSLYQAIKNRKTLESHSILFISISSVIIINLLYLLLISKKLNPNFLMPVFMSYPLVLLGLCKNWSILKRVMIVTLLLFSACLSLSSEARTLFIKQELSKRPDNLRRQNFILSSIKNANTTEPIHLLMSPSIAFQVHYLPLIRDMMISMIY
ncbi:hypothetical protein DID80_00005 [Candidatus Marinamargulisbacteria bacterium SCGC AAA071-K20]|nr:hypothetical protein DID80_00005 [Candidatus Marinamargulisbacteria bacterium SCGC AAA071-K20]